jgi:hypothetical protein
VYFIATHVAKNGNLQAEITHRHLAKNVRRVESGYSRMLRERMRRFYATSTVT